MKQLISFFTTRAALGAAAAVAVASLALPQAAGALFDFPSVPRLPHRLTQSETNFDNLSERMQALQERFTVLHTRLQDETSTEEVGATPSSDQTEQNLTVQVPQVDIEVKPGLLRLLPFGTSGPPSVPDQPSAGEGASTPSDSTSTPPPSTPTPAQEPAAAGSGQGMVSLNFDDAEASAYREAVPRMNAAGFKGTFYITTGFVGDSGHLTADQVRGLSGDGHEIGAHTRTHPHLPDLSEEEQRDEIVGSKDDLLNWGVASVPTFAYPYGEFDDSSVDIARANFDSARSSMGGFTHEGDDPYLLRVRTLRRDTAMREVEEWINAAREGDHWQILVFHRIDESSDEYRTTPDMFQDIVDYLTLHRVPVVTMAQGKQAIGL